MNFNFRAPISTAVAVGFGGIVLLTYIFEFNEVRSTILGWVVIVSATALLIGLVNLLVVHFNKIRAGQNPLYSFFLIAALLISFTITLLQGAEGAGVQWMFEYIQIPIESSLMAVLAVTLTYASTQLLNRRPNLYSVIFVAFVVLTLVSTAPFLGVSIPFLSNTLRPWVAHVLAGAGARGILIGVSLGTIATGIRILIGADRPFGG